MEFICFCIVALGIIGIFKKLFSENSNSSSSGNGRETSGAQNGYKMGPFEIRAIQVMRGPKKDLRAISIEGRGLLPVGRTMEIQFVTWAEDVTDDPDGEPVLCSIPNFQHHEMPTFQNVQDAGSLSPNQGFRDWVEVGVAPLDALTFPRSGSRNIRFYCNMSEKTAPTLRRGLIGGRCHIRVSVEETGYKEWKDKRLEALTLSLHLGIAMAHIDGDFARSEAAAIKSWLKKQIEHLDEKDQITAKERLNTALTTAVDEAKNRSLDISITAQSLKRSPVKNASYDALELCTIVMAADGVIHPSEMRLLREIGDLLGISPQELQGLTDKHTPAAKTQGKAGELSDELLVGLDPKLPPEEAKRKIREIFSRYNSMLTTERDPIKRKRYQDCIEAVARLRKKYG
jgi:uncharacterized tellurite resistance protein B-like protein